MILTAPTHTVAPGSVVSATRGALRLDGPADERVRCRCTCVKGRRLVVQTECHGAGPRPAWGNTYRSLGQLEVIHG